MKLLIDGVPHQAPLNDVEVVLDESVHGVPGLVLYVKLTHEAVLATVYQEPEQQEAIGSDVESYPEWLARLVPGLDW